MNSELEIAWAAGLLEGEGSFMIRRGVTPKISCGMTDLDILERLQKIFAGKIYVQTNKNPNWKQTWVWNLEGKDAAIVMEKILPYMGSRRTERISSILKEYKYYLMVKNAELIKKNTFKSVAAREYIESGGSLREIAKRYSISHVTLKNYVDELML